MGKGEHELPGQDWSDEDLAKLKEKVENGQPEVIVEAPEPTVTPLPQIDPKTWQNGDPRATFTIPVNPTRVQQGPMTPGQQEDELSSWNPHPRGSANWDRWNNGVRTQVPSEQPDVDLSELLSTQAEFIEAQTVFLNDASPRRPDFADQVVAYSKAQGKLIKAQQDVLKNLGII